MIQRKLLAVPFLLALVGCTDNIDSLSREYRNTTNEGIDALMMITDESSAGVFNVRVLKHLPPRFKNIDSRLEIVLNNKDSKEAFVKQVFESDGLQMYLWERPTNAQRMGLEMTRLRATLRELIKAKRIEMDAEGRFEDVNTAVHWPHLHELLINGEAVNELREQIRNPKILNVMSTFKGWKVDTFPVLHQKVMARTESFRAPEVKLIN